MSQWGNVDNAANSVNWAVSQVNKAITTANTEELFSNTTADVYFTGATVGQFGVDTTETAAANGVAHAGWVLRTEGSGGRSGRVHYETLVAMGSMSGDAEDTGFPDYRISITTQPSANSGNSTIDDTVSFYVAASSIPTGGTITYQWEYTTDPGNTATFATANGEAGFVGDTTTTLVVDANTISDGTLVRAVVSVVGGNDATSSSAELTVVT